MTKPTSPMEHKLLSAIFVQTCHRSGIELSCDDILDACKPGRTSFLWVNFSGHGSQIKRGPFLVQGIEISIITSKVSHSIGDSRRRPHPTKRRIEFPLPLSGFYIDCVKMTVSATEIRNPTGNRRR